MQSDTITETKPKISDGSDTKKFKRHIVERHGCNFEVPGMKGSLQDKTLCGELWDRAHPPTGEICDKCIEIYKRLNPGMPIPTI